MIKIKFPDGKIQEFENGVNALQIAQSISPSLAKKCVAAKINGNIIDLTRPINEDADFELLTSDSNELQDVLNHSCAHLLAQAVRELYPDALFGVGPAIEEGFYYDIDLGEVKLTEEDLAKIEKKMKSLAEGNFEVSRKEVSKDEALELFKELSS